MNVGFKSIAERIKGFGRSLLNWLQTKSGKIFWFLFIILSLTSFVATMAFSPEYSSFTAGMLKASMGIVIFSLFDKFALKEIDTIEELKKGNIAYAIFLACIAALIIAAMLSS